MVEFVVSEKILVDDIEEDPLNPNVMDKSQLDALDYSITDYKWLEDIVINKKGAKLKKFVIVNGHQRLKVLRKKGTKYVMAKIINVKPEDARAIGIAMNRNIGKDNPEKLSNALHYIYRHNKLELLQRLAPTAMTMDFMKIKIDQFHNTSLGQEYEEKIPPVPKSTKTKLGDMYRLGQHLVMCGDCTDPIYVNKLLGKAKVQSLVTDPPYGVDYAGKNSFLGKVNKKSRIQFAFEGDKDLDYRKFYAKFLKIIPFAEYNTAYIFMAGMRLHEVRMALGDAGLSWMDNLVWVKNHFVMSRKDYKPKCEFIVYAKKGKHKFYAEYATPNVFEQDKPQTSDDHPTQKPLPLVAKFIIHGTQPDFTVYDPFGGSGTTLMACENEGRVCFMMEIIPHFVDVIVKRWENFTKKKAKKL